MIKTEIETVNEQANRAETIETDPEVLSANPIGASWQLAISSLVVLLIVAIGGYLLYSNVNTKPIIPPVRNIGNLPALPLSANADSRSSSTSGTSSLSASSFNLQNNLPSGQGSPKTNSVQSTGNALSTGQSINTTTPY